jgi:DNA transposition AAA+ family ATPase
MTEELKAQIVRGMKDYMQEHSMSQGALHKLTGISTSYISYLMREMWNDVPSDGGRKTTKIEDQIFLKLQKALGLRNDFFETDNYVSTYVACRDAKERQEWRIVDGMTGAGKSFSVERFARLHPRETFLIRCKDTMNAKEFMQAVAHAVGASEAGTRYRICMSITERLLTMSNPLLILDESEALFKRNSEGGFGAIKDICVEVDGRVGIVLVGANKFMEKLQKQAINMRGSFPQLHNRFKSNLTQLAPLTREDVATIAPAFGVTDRKEINRLFDTSDNFRDLFATLRAVQADQALLTANAA